MKKTKARNYIRIFLPYSNVNQKALSDEGDTQINRSNQALRQAQNRRVGSIKQRGPNPAEKYFSGRSGFFIRKGGFSSQSKIKTARPEAIRHIILSTLAYQNTNWWTYGQVY